MNTLKKGSRGTDVVTLQKLLNVYPDGIFGKLTDEAVRAFQKSKNLVVDGIVGAKTWAALGVTDSTPTSSLKKSKRNITEIIVHCTATPEGQDFSVDDIRRWHVQGRGWSDIGYHYVVYRDGSVHVGRDVNISGGHCTGHNYCSIGVVYVGGIKAGTKGTSAADVKDTRTPGQKAALLKLLKELKQLYPKAKIYGHRDFAAKACPSFDAKKEYANI